MSKPTNNIGRNAIVTIDEQGKIKTRFKPPTSDAHCVWGVVRATPHNVQQVELLLATLIGPNDSIRPFHREAGEEVRG